MSNLSIQNTSNCLSRYTPQILQKTPVQIAVGTIAFIVIAYIVKNLISTSRHKNLSDASVDIVFSMNDSSQPSYTMTTAGNMEACNEKMQRLWKGLQKPGDGQYLGHGNLYEEARHHIKFDLIRTHYIGDADESDGKLPDVHAPIVDGITVMLKVAVKIFGDQAVTFSLNDKALSFLQNSEWMDASKQEKPELEFYDPTFAYSQKILHAWKQSSLSPTEKVSGAVMLQKLEACYVNDKARKPIFELYSDGAEKLVSNYYIPLDEMLRHLDNDK